MNIFLDNKMSIYKHDLIEMLFSPPFWVTAIVFTNHYNSDKKKENISPWENIETILLFTAFSFNLIILQKIVNYFFLNVWFVLW